MQSGNHMQTIRIHRWTEIYSRDFVYRICISTQRITKNYNLIIITNFQFQFQKIIYVCNLSLKIQNFKTSSTTYLSSIGLRSTVANHLLSSLIANKQTLALNTP